MGREAKARDEKKHTGFVHSRGRCWMCICAPVHRKWREKVCERQLKQSLCLLRVAALDDGLLCWEASALSLRFKIFVAFGTSTESDVGLCGLSHPTPK